ncbi:MAG TPA: hypothetical protein VMR19_00620 [Candidatus Saccharimonadales bacterium]|nr:hypothetical protein [Candidatus Saccharimonadales bacterium]
MDEKILSLKGEDKGDIVSKTKTLYDASPAEIFWKNFLVGFGRGLGGVFIWLILLFIAGILFINLVLPKLMPSITNFENLLKPTPNTQSESGSTIPVDLNIQKLFGQ